MGNPTEYARKLAMLVLDQRPKNAQDSVAILTKILEQEGYEDPESFIFLNLRNEVAEAARQINAEKSRRRAS